MTSLDMPDVPAASDEPDPLAHVRHLAETIGPRGSTTEAELEATKYVAERLAHIGLEAKLQNFSSAYSAYTPYAIATGLFLLGVFLYRQPQMAVDAAAALFLGSVTFAALLMEMQFKDNLLRWVQSRGDSTNVFAVIPAAQATPQTHQPPIVITAHVDSHRTPLLFSSAGFLKLFQLLLPAAVLSMAILLGLFLIGIFGDAQWLRNIALIPGAVILVAFLLMLQADFTPFNKGADDNASGVAAGLDLAQRLLAQPLQTRAVHVVFTGCEEVACYGADAYFAQHRAELKNAIHLVIDQVGNVQADPCIVRGERFLVAAPSDPQLLEIADHVIAAHPELHAHSRHTHVAYSELSVGARYGLRTIGLGAMLRNGQPVETWHRPTDTLEHISADVLQRSTELAWQLLQGIDQAHAITPSA